MGPYPHPQHPLSRSAGLAIALYTPLLGLHLYRIQGITVIVITKLQLNRSATVVLETFRDIKGAAVLCVTLNRYDGVANWHAKDSASDIFSTTAKAWLAGWLTDWHGISWLALPIVSVATDYNRMEFCYRARFDVSHSQGSSLATSRPPQTTNCVCSLSWLVPYTDTVWLLRAGAVTGVHG